MAKISHDGGGYRTYTTPESKKVLINVQQREWYI